MMNFEDSQKIKFQVVPGEQGTQPALQIQGLDGSYNESVIADIFSFGSPPNANWQYAESLFNDFVIRQGFGSNGRGIAFPHEADEWENQQGVKLYNPVGEIELSEEAFDAIILKYFHALRKLIQECDRTRLETNWGKQLLEYLHQHK